MGSTLGSGRQTLAWTPGGLNTQGERASQSELDRKDYLKPPLQPAPPWPRWACAGCQFRKVLASS